jgi:arginyl-tRNA synthetase
MNLQRQIQEKLAKALEGLVPEPGNYSATVKPAQDPRFGDYQVNCAMALAKVLGGKPHDIASRIAARFDTGDLFEPPEIAGPGFINLRFRMAWLAAELQKIAGDERLGVGPVGSPETVVVDFSSPNVAKPMHVGHLRSTVIGDALSRLYRFLGHQVITDNHLGDWGTQFGILLYGYKNYLDKDALAKDPVREMVRLYVLVRDLMKAGDNEDEEGQAGSPIADAARQETAKLHAGDPENLRLWQEFMPWCLEEIERVYRRLDVHFDHAHGESFYNPRLQGVVTSLLEKGIAHKSEGAVVIFIEPDKPAIIQKQDGAFTYTTSDLATIRYRIEEWNPIRILYVVGTPQSFHFQNLFAAARRWGYTNVELRHIAFGSVLGTDRRPIRTREGGAIELGQLLDEAVERASGLYEQSREERKARGEDVPELNREERESISQIVGIGAVKYADLSQNRTSDYVFSWDKMLAMDGNTGTYMQYAYARIRSIFRKGNVDVEALRQEAPLPRLEEPEERALALLLLRLEETLLAAAEEYKPNIVTAYLWDLAKSYNAFYQNCPVLKAGSDEVRRSRLLLCDLTGRTIQLGLGILGIKTPERM